MRHVIRNRLKIRRVKSNRAAGGREGGSKKASKGAREGQAAQNMLALFREGGKLFPVKLQELACAGEKNMETLENKTTRMNPEKGEVERPNLIVRDTEKRRVAEKNKPTTPKKKTPQKTPTQTNPHPKKKKNQTNP